MTMKRGSPFNGQPQVPMAKRGRWFKRHPQVATKSWGAFKSPQVTTTDSGSQKVKLIGIQPQNVKFSPDEPRRIAHHLNTARPLL